MTDPIDTTRSGSEPLQGELEALVASARSGDRDALGALATAVRPRLLRWALVRLGDPDEAEDLAQVVLSSLETDLAKYDGRSRFLTWLYRVTMNRISDRVRAMRTRETLERRKGPGLVGGGVTVIAGTSAAEHPEGPDPVAVVEETRLLELVRAFFEDLPARQRQVFDLVDLQGWSPREAAEALGMRPVTVRTNLLRARRTIRARLVESAGALVEDFAE